MAEMALSFARENLLPLLVAEVNILWNVPKEFADIRDELESIQAFIKDADRKAAVEGDNTNEGIQIWVKQLREASFRIEDVIDEYIIHVGLQPRDPGCAAFVCEIVHFIKTLIPRFQIAPEIQDIKSCLGGIKERSERFGFQSSFEKEWHDPRIASLYIEEAEVVGFEGPRDELIGWLIDGPSERTVISLVGMGGQGKTTLAKKVFDNVIGQFDCHAWIRVSQSYTVERLLREMLEKFCKEEKGEARQDISKMDRESLTDEVRDYLCQKRYVVLFDDVWDVRFWDKIEFAVIPNNKRSRIFITTRNMDVVECCMKSSSVKVHNLKSLSREKSFELFCKKAFRFGFDGCCPKEFKEISFNIVEKCDGLPLAIVAIGGLLCSKEKITLEWERFCQNLSLELEKNPHLTDITKILGLGYDDLPYYLKSCLLYFGMHPKDCEVESVELIQQWIAEGFVKYERGKTFEEVGKQYLSELIHRSLVQVSSFSIDGKAKRCRVHDLLREMILKKIEDLSFCQFVSEDDQSVNSGMIRRLKIATNSNNLMGTIESSHIRSLYIFGGEELPEDFVRQIPTKYRLLKVLDFEHPPLNYVPIDLGSLFHLRYLSFRKTNVESLPNSIGNLQNLETLDLRQTRVRKMPREINQLKKLRHLLANHTSWCFDYGIQMMDGIGGLVSLQTLRQVEADHGGVELIKELEKLRQLRVLGLIHVKRECGSTLCSSINKMRQLEKLYIDAISFDEVIDLHFDLHFDLHYISPLPVLQKLRLRGKLERSPDWIRRLQNLVKLSLISSKLTNDPLKSLKYMPNLLLLSLDSAYEGEDLHFEDGGFQKLKQLSLRHLYGLNSILIGEGALPSLKEFVLVYIPQLKEVPSGIHHLGKLEVFHIVNMPEEFRESIREDPWINKHVPHVYITDSVRQNYWDKETCIIRDSRH